MLVALRSIILPNKAEKLGCGVSLIERNYDRRFLTISHGSIVKYGSITLRINLRAMMKFFLLV